MPLDIRILTGARAGQSERFDKPTVVVGRASQTDLRFDAQKDLDVSGRHAEIRGSGGGAYELHDSGSTNGTFVNGVKVQGSAKLKPGDHVKFGAEGPEVEVQFRLTGAVKKAGSTEERVAVAVKQQTAGLRRLILVGMGVVAVGLAIAFWIGQRSANAQIEHLKQQLHQIPTVQLGVLDDTALSSEIQRYIASLRNRLQGATTDTERDSISSEIVRLESRVSGLVRMDLGTIASRNSRAVALLITTIDGKNFSGTAFGITPDGLLLTNRHNVRSLDGKDTTTRLAIKFSETDGFLPARVVKISEDPDADLALIQMERPDQYPAVAGIQSKDDNAGLGASVAIIGFPFGYETVQQGDTAKSTLNGGTVSKRTSAVLQVDSFAGSGSSGSPVFSARGTVVGVVWGGQAEAGGRIVYAVPPDKIAAFLGSEFRSIVKE